MSNFAVGPAAPPTLVNAPARPPQDVAPAATPQAEVTVAQPAVAEEPAAAYTGESHPSGTTLLEWNLFNDDEGVFQGSILSAKAHVGEQTEFRASLAEGTLRAGEDAPASLQAEVMSARVHAGIHNDDGSTGFNAGAVARAVGYTSSLSTGASGMSIGLGIGAGAGFHVGGRDADSDGYKELCVGLDLGFFKIGVQLEDPRGWGVFKTIGKLFGGGDKD